VTEPDLQIFQSYANDQISYETLVRLWLGTPPSQETADYYADLDAFGLYTLSQPPGGTQPLSAGSLRAKALSGPSAATVTGTYTLSSSTPSLPFLGERTLVLDADLFDNNTSCKRSEA